MRSRVYKVPALYVVQQIGDDNKPTGEYVFGTTEFRALERVTWEKGKVSKAKSLFGLLVNVPDPRKKPEGGQGQ